MKRKHSSQMPAGDSEQENRLSNLLFNKSKKFVENLKSAKEEEGEIEQKPVWVDDDDLQSTASIIPNTTTKDAYSVKLKQKYQTLMGTPSWANFNKRTKAEDEDDEILRTVGHLHNKKSDTLQEDILEISKFPRINFETKNEGPTISCIEFHPKISVSLVSGESGNTSLFSIGGDVNNKLHSFKLKRWKSFAAHFTPDGSEAYIASKMSHNYCIYNLEKAKTQLIQLPKVVQTPKIFQLSSDGKYIATSCGYDEVYILCAKSQELLRAMKHNENIESVSFSHNSEELYCYEVQGQVTIWSMRTFRPVKKFFDHGCVSASCITTSPCGRLLATGSGEGIVNIYENSNLTTSNPMPLKTVSNLRTRITNLKFNATTELLALSSVYYPNAVKLVHIPSYHVFSNFPSHALNHENVSAVSFSPNSGYMAVGNNKSYAYLYRLKHFKNY